MTLRSLLDIYKDFVKADGKAIRTIAFTFGGETYLENDMNETLSDLGIEDGMQIVSTVLYNGGKIFILT